MMSSNFLFYLTWILLGGTGLSLTITWWKFSRRPVQPLGRALNIWTIAVLTAGYAYFVIITAVTFAPWDQMINHWWLFRKPEAVALLNVFLSLAAIVAAVLKGGAVRAYIVCSGVSLGALSVLFFYGLSVSQI